MTSPRLPSPSRPRGRGEGRGGLRYQRSRGLHFLLGSRVTFTRPPGQVLESTVRGMKRLTAKARGSNLRLTNHSFGLTVRFTDHFLLPLLLLEKKKGREKRSAVKRMRPLTSYLRSSSGLSSPDLKTQPICPVHPSSFPRPRRREGKGRCTRNPSVYSLFLLLPEQKGRREETGPMSS